MGLNRQQKRKMKAKELKHKENVDRIYIDKVLSEVFNAGAARFREAVGIELGIGDKRMARVDERFYKIVTEWDGLTVRDKIDKAKEVGRPK